MAGHPKSSPAREAGASVWTRFLSCHLDCSVKELNRQLLFEIEPGEVFVFGKSPRPHPENTAPKYFQSVFSGANPDGNYWLDPDHSNVRFNLYERVLARVPESGPWYLGDLEHFLRLKPLTISRSTGTLIRLLDDRQAVLVDAGALSGWERFDPDGLAHAEQAVIERLIAGATPDSVSFFYTLLHSTVWEDSPASQLVLPIRREHCRRATTAFLDSPILTGEHFDSDLIRWLDLLLEIGVDLTEGDGKRSLLTGRNSLLLPLPTKILPVPRTQGCLDAMRCLSAGGEHAWKELNQPLPGSFCPTGWDLTEDQFRAAAAHLRQAALEMAERFGLGLRGAGRSPRTRSTLGSRNSQLH